MFVEKLTLFGFKSFNKKVTLEFGSGISGILGPNGCGKSNVVDAMRWVLGEQSTKQLRGAKMEDVIFNGTRSEKPLSLAEVELTLNNERGKLPIDYSTVSVARRLYRSGASEYFINKKLVRLKDVRELFMDTGMGSHAYSVIERQMVDNILSDTTGHRRFLFEEAAGIMKYKTRKKEALAKLEATERDLLRVNDIIVEVERQVGSLKRQVGKARRYRELMDEIRGLDLAFSQRRRMEWLEQIAAVDAGHQNAVKTAEEGETQVTTIDARLQETHLVLMEEERALSEARENLAQVDDDLGRSNSRILVLRERLESTHTRIHEAKEYKVRLTDRRDRNVNDTRTKKTTLEELSGHESKEQEVLSERETTLAAAEEKVRGLKEKLSNNQEAWAESRDKQVRAESEVEAADRRGKEQTEQMEARENRSLTVREEEKTLKEGLGQAQTRLETAKGRVEAVEEDLRVYGMRRDNHAARTEVARRGVAEKREQEAAARSRLLILEELQATYEGFDPGVRALMLEDTREPSVKGTLGDLIHLPAEWSAALEPALSQVWQYLVVSDSQAARHLVGRLREEALGFASLISLDRVPETAPRQGSLTWAAEVVDTDPAYRGLVRYVLDGLALVNDLDTALKVVREGQAVRAATRTGQFVDQAVISGGTGGPSGSELLEREKALERCRASAESLMSAVKELVAHEGELTQEETVLESKKAELDAKLQEAVSGRTDAEKEEAEFSVRLSHCREVLADLEREGAGLQKQKTELVAERARLVQELEGYKSLAEAAGNEIQTLETELTAAESGREEVLAAVHELRIRWSKLEAELQECRKELGRLGEQSHELTTEWDRTVQEEKDSETRVIEITEELETLATTVQELHVTRDQRAETVANREREKSEAAAAELQDSEALREIRRRATGARQESHNLELKLHELRTSLEHLEERLLEEYEVSGEELNTIEIGEIPENAPETLADMKERIRRLGPVNLLAVEEYDEKAKRFEFMTTQRDDLFQAKDSLLKTIDQINQTASGMFLETFSQVQENFERTFKVLFQGGECSLELTGEDPLEADIDVRAQPRGKKPQGIQQLSSGERALTAIALLFAIYLVKPSPFCILDEVDAPLDDANIDRFVNMVKEFSGRTQFIVITHNKKTMEVADCLYGITMQRPGVSSVVSVKLDGVARDVPKENGNGSGTHEDSLSPESVIAQ